MHNKVHLLKTAKKQGESACIDRLVQTAVANAIEEHRRMGRSIVVWRDGKVVTIPPEEIPVRTIEELPATA